VASNTALRSLMEEKCSEEGLKLHFPSPIYCTDNAAMIGVAAYFEYLNENFRIELIDEILFPKEFSYSQNERQLDEKKNGRRRGEQ